MLKEFLAQKLREAEAAHAASGDPSSNWPEWYAQWLLQHGVEVVPSGPPMAAKLAAIFDMREM